MIRKKSIPKTKVVDNKIHRIKRPWGGISHWSKFAINKLFSITFAFALNLLSQNGTATEINGEWGTDIYSSSSIRISAPGKEVVIIDLRDVTKVSGKVCAPVVVIENYTLKVLISNLLEIEANVLSINGHQPAFDFPYFGREALPSNLKLLLNSQDVRQKSPALIQEPKETTIKINKNFFQDLSVDTHLEYFTDILKRTHEHVGNAQQIKMNDITQWQMSQPVTVSRNDKCEECITLTKLRCYEIQYVPPGVFGMDFHTPVEATTVDEFKKFFNEFITSYNVFSDPDIHFNLKISNSSATIWIGNCTSFTEQRFKDYVLSPLPKERAKKNIKDQDRDPNRALLNQFALVMNRPSIPLNGEVLSLKLGRLQYLIEDQYHIQCSSYHLEFFAKDD